jgi:hypothetical protein
MHRTRQNGLAEFVNHLRGSWVWFVIPGEDRDPPFD